MMDDLISSQAAIDIERNATVDTNPSHFEAHQKFTQFMDDAEISSFGRWQWSNGFNTALTAVGIDLKKLPSAQPERLTNDDFETIRIHLSAFKEDLCNQHRWKEAEDYERLIDRFISFASTQSEIIRCKDCKYYKENTLVCSRYGLEDDDYCSWAERKEE